MKETVSKTLNKRVTQQEIATGLFLVSLILVAMNNNLITTIVYYGAILICCIALVHVEALAPPLFFLTVICASTLAFLNMILVNNVTVARLFILASGFFVAMLFANNRVTSRVFLFSTLVYSAVVLTRFASDGVSTPVFDGMSNNYISVYLLAPLVIYCIKKEEEGKPPALLPVVLAWILSVLGGSRSGLIAISFLLVAVLFHRVLAGKSNKRKILRILLITGILVITLLTVLPIILNRFSGYRIVERFLSYGFESNSRMRMWKEYFGLLKNPRYLVFGGPVGEVYWAAKFYNGNIHNSFLIVHSCLGILGFFGMAFFLFNSIVFAAKNRRYAFIYALIALSIRALTDHVFGCYRLTPFFLLFLLYPFIAKTCGCNRVKEVLA